MAGDSLKIHHWQCSQRVDQGKLDGAQTARQNPVYGRRTGQGQSQRATSNFIQIIEQLKKNCDVPK